MASLYGDAHRKLQDAFEVRQLADTVQMAVLREVMEERDKAFIESSNMFFLSTVDHKGRPTVSYKGGAPGFVRVLDDKTLAFPSYDGNAMFLSMGNISHSAHVGMLFIDFERPRRLRIQGEASVHSDDTLMERYPEAQLIVRLQVTEVFQNCPRYVHKMRAVEASPFVPRDKKETPLPDWKRIDLLQDSLPSHDKERVEKYGGLLSVQEYEALQLEDD